MTDGCACEPEDPGPPSISKRLARAEPILALAIRGLAWADHPCAPDLDLLLTHPPGVIVATPSANMWICIVLPGCPPEVRAATERLTTASLPPGVTRIRVR